MNSFISLDVETANQNFDSICQIGIAGFKDGKLSTTFKSYINPEDYFDPFNTLIHGITSDMVKDAPTFGQVYSSLRTNFDHQIVVHHTAFDRSSMNQAAYRYGLEPFEFQWLDSARVARRAWDDCRKSSYSLSSLAAKFNIIFNPHDALEDAKVAGEIMLHAIEETGVSLEEWTVKAYKDDETPSRHIARSGNPEGPLCGEVIVFTGALNQPRAIAADIAAQAGCEVGDGITVKTTLLVVGVQDRRQLAGKDKSAKHVKAEQLISKGIPIRIISETDFYNLVKIA